jgi:molybdopterin synthase catalytic subunit
MMRSIIKIQREPIEESSLIHQLSKLGKTGAIVTFSGLCRDENETLEKLEIEHYPAMASNILHHLTEEALTRWPLHKVLILHRYGLILPGETIVIAAAASTRRRTAFEAASFMMDLLKTRAPFWKKEHFKNGNPPLWVKAREEDEQRSQEWSLPR